MILLHVKGQPDETDAGECLWHLFRGHRREGGDTFKCVSR